MSDINRGIRIVPFEAEHFAAVQAMCEQEGWSSYTSRADEALAALQNSQVALVALEGERVVGFLRAISDGHITTYLAEILVERQARGKMIGTLLINACHARYPKTRIDLLSTENASSFYEKLGFRAFEGYRQSQQR